MWEYSATLIRGTDKGLIQRWIIAIEKDIQEHKFYCIDESHEEYFISSVNKARLLIMYNIFSITSNDYSEGSSRYFRVHKVLLEKAEEKMTSYLETMKELLK